MSQKLIRNLPILGFLAAITLLAFSFCRYSGDVEWTRMTVSLLCAKSLPNDEPNLVRGLSIAALLLLCASIALLFQLISQKAETRIQQSTIQIAGIGSMVYALLTATPMHNLMVDIALAFFMIALLAIVQMLFRKRFFVLASLGVACIAVKVGSASLYYANAYTEIWGLLQKLSFIVTAIWLFAVHLTLEANSDRANSDEHHAKK